MVVKELDLGTNNVGTGGLGGGGEGHKADGVSKQVEQETAQQIKVVVVAVAETLGLTEELVLVALV